MTKIRTCPYCGTPLIRFSNSKPYCPNAHCRYFQREITSPTKLTKEERHELCKILRRYISDSDYEASTKEGFRRVLDDYETYGNPDDLKEFKLLKDLIDEAVGG